MAHAVALKARHPKSSARPPHSRRSPARRPKAPADVLSFVVTLFPDEEDGGFVVECPSIPGCMSQGDTEEEALENIKDAIRGCLEVRSRLGMPLTVSTRQVEIPV